ncbi:MAG: KH domain-containing protein [Clostridia bacterium]|nr:KH domain-containing protein [Clostridia bacterium]
MELKQILTDIARAIVDNPDAVNVTESVDGDNVELVLTVAEGDTGMVIGRHGRIAKAIRQVMKAAANTCGKHVTVEIK